MKRILSLLLLLAMLLSLAACADPVIGGGSADEPISADPAAAPGAVIELQGDSIRFNGRGAAVSGSTVTIGTPGSYTVRGTLSDGQIVVDLKENPGKVTLFLDGADITCLTDSAIYVKQVKELNLVLAAGSENRVVSGTEADLAGYNELRQGAAIYAEDDLDIQGEGSLTVYGYLNNGITAKDDLKLKGGTLRVVAANNGIRASESVTLSGGEITVDAGNDGVKTSSAKKADKGFVQIEGGALRVTAGGDGVAAETELRILGGTISVTTGGDPNEKSCKGLKGKTGVAISGGEISVEAEDHAVRSGAAMSITGGALTLVSRQGKGLNAETELTVSEGSLSVTAADDGLACADTVRVTGGTLLIRSGADGIQGGRKGTGFTAEVGTVSIEGGHTEISAYNKAVDAKAAFSLRGGLLYACGGGCSEPLGELPWLRYAAQGSAGSLELSLSADETAVLQAAYGFRCVLFFSPALREGESYTLRFGSQTLKAAASHG